MKKSISRWALPAGWPLERCAAIARAAGFEAMELALDESGGDLDLASGPGQAAAVADVMKKAGLEVASLATMLFWKYPLSSRDESTRERAAAVLGKMIELAPALKTDALLVVPGLVDEQTPNEIAWQRSQESIKRLLPAAAEAGVVLGIENVWNKMLLTPLEMKWYIDEFRHPTVQAYFDVGNMLVSGYPQHWIRILGSRVKRIHLKDFKLSVGNIEGFCDLLEGDVDYPEVMHALRDIGYDGYLTVEVFPRRRHPESLVHAAGQALDFILGT